MLPVDAPSRHRLARLALLPDLLLVAVQRVLSRDRSRELRAIRQLRREHQNISHTALDDLRLNARHPSVAYGSMRSVGMQQQPVVLGRLLTLPPGLGTPFEFKHEMVVAEVVLRGHIAITTTADVKRAVSREGPHILGGVVKIRLRIDVIINVSRFDHLQQIDLRFNGFGGRQKACGTNEQHGNNGEEAHEVNTTRVSESLRQCRP